MLLPWLLLVVLLVAALSILAYRAKTKIDEHRDLP
jgi:hypothetical protein